MGVDAPYASRFETPTLIERGRAQTLQCRVYRAGALAAPSSGTVSIYDQANTAQVSAQAVTVSGSIATYAYNPAATLVLADGWRIEWLLTMPDANVHTFRNEAALVRCAPHANVTEADLYRRCSSLDPSGPAVIHAQPHFADKLDEAQVDVANRLLAAGNRINLVLSPAALREPVLLLTLALIFEDFRTRLSDAYAAIAADYRNQFEAAWSRVRLTYDASDAGQATTRNRRSAASSVWLCSRERS